MINKRDTIYMSDIKWACAVMISFRTLVDFHNLCKCAYSMKIQIRVQDGMCEIDLRRIDRCLQFSSSFCSVIRNAGISSNVSCKQRFSHYTQLVCVMISEIVCDRMRINSSTLTTEGAAKVSPARASRMRKRMLLE